MYENVSRKSRVENFFVERIEVSIIMREIKRLVLMSSGVNLC